MNNLTHTSDYLANSLKQLGFVLMSKKGGAGLPLVAFRINPKANKHYDEFALAHQLRQRSWVVPAYTMAPHTKNLKMLRVVVREDFSKSRCDQLLADIKLCQGVLDQMDKDDIKKHSHNIRLHQNRSHTSQKAHSHYKNEKHSLQGKTGKTHAAC
jgi:glutamate decarboxylase